MIASGRHMIEMFDHVLVDEYQDVNALQVEIVRALRPDGRGLTVVGDDAQAIYGFRGSDARYLHQLATSLPGVTVIALEHNFRSVQPILNLANLVRPSEAGVRLTLRGERPGGRRPVLVRCHDAPSEARAVVDRILDAHEQGMRLRDQAVLVRAAHHSDLIELELTARRVPYRKYGGLRFVEAAHVKDFAAAVRLLDNPADELAWFRLLRMHDGIGPARGRMLLALLAPEAGSSDYEWAEAVAAAPARSRVALNQTLQSLEAAREQVGTPARVTAILRALRPLVLSRYSEGPARVEDLDRLASAASAMDDLSAWVAEITLDPPVATGDLAGPPHLDEDYVVISTVHSAKGLEWLAVHLPHLIDGAFPSDMALTLRGRTGRGAQALLRGHDEGSRPAHPVHAPSHAHPPAGSQRPALPGACEPVPLRGSPWRARHPGTGTCAPAGGGRPRSVWPDHGRSGPSLALSASRAAEPARRTTSPELLLAASIWGQNPCMNEDRSLPADKLRNEPKQVRAPWCRPRSHNQVKRKRRSSRSRPN